MWNKKESDDRTSTPEQTRQQAPAPSAATERPRGGSGKGATIGSSLTVTGDISGEEDLLIEGRVEGEIRLSQHSVTVGRSGRVEADVFGKSIKVEGEVQGNLTGESEVVIRNTGRVEGNITAPRVTLEDGSSFRGAIDMQSPQKAQSSKATPSREASEAPGRSTGGDKGATGGAPGKSAGAPA